LRILAVETAAATASVAVLQDGVLLGESSINNKKTHSQNLMPMLVELMAKLDLQPDDIDFFAASIGPGSFTGLRIGVSIVKAMAFAVDKPTLAVPTLDAMAEGHSGSAGIICPMLDARNNQVFTAIYKVKDGEVERVSEYMGVPVTELLELLEEYQDVIFTGDGSVLHRDAIQNMNQPRWRFAKNGSNLNRALDVALVAQKMIERGEITNSETLKPFYLRKSQAERMYEQNMR